MPQNALFSSRAREPQNTLLDPANSHWQTLGNAFIDHHWNGPSALGSQGQGWSNLTRACSCWNEQMLFLYFEAWFDSLNVDPQFGDGGPIDGLWNKDVVEVFLGPPNRDDYFEIQVSPLGQWLDLRVLSPRTAVDVDWNSNLELKVTLSQEEGLWHTFLGLPWESLGTGPPTTAVTVWRLNLFRIAGLAETREYLAWRPTFTSRPDFHVPSSFGRLILWDK